MTVRSATGATTAAEARAARLAMAADEAVDNRTLFERGSL
jgi:hypothetical protein